MADGIESTVRDGRARRRRDESGAALLEFALIFPIFMTLVLGMFSGGISYNRKIGMTNAVAEASRYGATLAPSTLTPPPLSSGIDEWVRKVVAAVRQNADGDLDQGVDGRRICVAYVHPAADADPATPHNQLSHMDVMTTSDTTPFLSVPDTPARCFDDGRPDSERRVQIEVRRNSPIDALFFSYDLTLTARSVTRFEATSY